MVGNHEYVYGADAIDRTHQLEFFIRGKISQMEHAEVAVRDDDSDRLPVFDLGQYGFTCPAPGNDDLIVSPADATTRTSILSNGIVSPRLTTVCFALL